MSKNNNPNNVIANQISNGKSVNNDNLDIGKDYLTVDKPIPGQTYVCLSFINPEDVIVQKDLWKCFKFHNHIFTSLGKYIGNMFEKLDDQDEITHKDVLEISNKIKKMHDVYRSEYNDWLDMYKNYELEYGQKDDEEFDKQNDFRTSVRGVKIRGVYATHEEASARAAYLQKMDNTMHIFVAPVGYWLPVNADPDKLSIEDQQYAEKELNELMHAFAENSKKKDIYYKDQTRQRIKKTEEEVIEKKKLQANNNANNNNDDDDFDEILLDE